MKRIIVPGDARDRQLDPPTWGNRWSALAQAVQDVIDSFPVKLANKKEDWQVTLESTLHCLQAFGEKQFNFFQNGFKQGGWLVDSPRYKAEYALRNTLDQIAFDLSVLQRARNQRLETINRGTESPFFLGPDVLALADKLAHKALEPAITAGLLQDTAVITYFQKSSHVRVVPYAPVALIGIPYTCIDVENNARDFLSIPHEVGHYLYWHGKLNGTRLNALLRSIISNEPLWRTNWLEEIFADVYGCLVAGPVLAHDFQEVLFDNLNLFEDDGEHPVAAIRPYLYTDTLRALKSDTQQDLFPNAPTKLDQKWENLRQFREEKESFKPKRGSSGNEVLLDSTREPIKEAISAVLTVLQAAVPQKEDDLWSNDAIDPDAYPYQDFKTAVLNKLAKAPPKLLATKDQAVLEAPKQPGEVLWHTGDSSVEWFELFNSAQRNGLKLLPETWNTLLEGGGWAAGGPDTDDSPK